MKNLIKVCIAAFILIYSVSCREVGPSTSTFTFATTFELEDTEAHSYLVDSLMYLPEFSMEEISYFFSRSLEINSGYEGGFKISTKKGVENADDPNAIFTSAGSSAGALDSKYYLGYLRTGIMPDYDIKFDLSSYSSGSCMVVGCYINNSEYTKRLYDAGEIKSGDFLKVTMEFFKNGSFLGSWSKYLVDGINKLEPEVVTDWYPWDVAKETKEKSVVYNDVDAVRFIVETSPGKLKPCFCIDNFTVRADIVY